MARHRDRYKSGKENIAITGTKDESDCATLQSEVVFLKTDRPDKGRESQLMNETVASQPPQVIRADKQTLLGPLQLCSESGSSEHSRVELRSSASEQLFALEAKIDALAKKYSSNHAGETADQDCTDIQEELKKILQATIKQKEEFNQLSDLVKKQNQTIKRFENMIKDKKFGLSNVYVSSLNSRSVSAVQCIQDLEELSRNNDQPVVYLIRGHHEFHRKMSQCGSDNNILDNISIPDSFNAGNRMLPGRQDYPHSLLESLPLDVLADLRTMQVPQKPSGNSLFHELGAMGGAKDVYSLPSISPSAGQECPMCGEIFPQDGALEAFLMHVDSHWTD